MTIKQAVRDDIDLAIKSNKYITWGILNISPFPNGNPYPSYEAQIAFEYFDTLGYAYEQLIYTFPDLGFHPNRKGFFKK